MKIIFIYNLAGNDPFVKWEGAVVGKPGFALYFYKEPQDGRSRPRFARMSLKNEEEVMAESHEDAAKAGLDARLPEIETFPSRFRDYEITIEIPEFTSVCPKTGLPDFGVITLRYVPDSNCVELKSLKMYILAYRNLGIFYENAVNRILEDVVAACRPVRACVTGVFTPRGGIRSTIEARYPRET